MKKILTLILLCATSNLFAENYNSISLQGVVASTITGVTVDIMAGENVVSTANSVDLVPNADGEFSVTVDGFNSKVFLSGSNYSIRFSTPGVVIASVPVQAIPFALAVRGENSDGNIFGNYGNVGVGTSTPGYSLVISSAAGETGTIMVVSTGTSNIFWVAGDGAHATKFYGDGAGLTGIAATGDNLGNHVATTTLNMAGYSIDSAGNIASTGDITAVRYQISGSTVLAVLPGTGSLGVGLDAGPGNAGDYNTFVGNSAGASNTSGMRNSFLGSGAGMYNTSGTYNTFVGMNAGAYNTTGQYNTSVGLAAGANGGYTNVFIGAYAGSDSRGDDNVTVGFYSGRYLNNYAWGNTFLGTYAGQSQTGGGGNTFLGYQAGSSSLGSSNIVIGASQDVPVPGASDTLNIGGVIFGNLIDRTIGISTRNPLAALDIVSTGTASDNIYAQIWRDSTGAAVASMTVTGKFYAAVPLTSDNLGNHIATTTLNMNSFGIVNVASITIVNGLTVGSSVTVGGALGVSAAQVRLSSNVVVSSETNTSLGAGVRVSTNVYIVGFSSAAKYYGDGSALTGVMTSGDNLGNHVATTTLNMNNHGVENVTLIAMSTSTGRPASPVAGVIVFSTTSNKLEYYNGSKWMTFQAIDSNFSITGGDEQYSSGDYQIHKFTNSGTFTVTGGQITADVLIVAGGGGAAGSCGGGGGGGLIYRPNMVLSGTTTVTVGIGGTGGASIEVSGSDGGNSVFGALTAKGGAGGEGSGNGRNGGSGGGGGYASSVGGTGLQPTEYGDSGYPYGFGYNGGRGNNPGYYPGGGGGGAGSAGGAAGGTSVGGAAGIGRQYDIDGENKYYAGGGSGGTESGGTRGANSNAYGGGKDHTGGGGDSYVHSVTGVGDNGAKGIVIVRYRR